MHNYYRSLVKQFNVVNKIKLLYFISRYLPTLNPKHNSRALRQLSDRFCSTLRKLLHPSGE